MKKLITISFVLLTISFLPSEAYQGMRYSDFSVKKQLDLGILPEDAVCPQNISIRIKKISDQSFACVKSETSKILVEREWGTILFHPMCIDESGNRVDYIVMITDKKRYAKSEKINAIMKNCGDDPSGYGSNDWGFTLESADGKTKGRYCAAGEEVVSIRPNEKVNWTFNLKALCFDSGFPAGEYWIYLSESNPIHKGKFSIFIE